MLNCRGGIFQYTSMIKKGFFLSIIVFATFLMALYMYFVNGIHFDRKISYPQNNAIWVEHSFSEEEKSDSEIQVLVTTLLKHNLRTVFLHAGPIELSGVVPPERYRRAKVFLEKARKFSKDIVWQAWLGQIRSKLPLENPEVRKNIVQSATILTSEIGFDGIHYDIEPIFDGDKNFLALLRETREALSEKAPLSVASDEWQSRPLTLLLSKIVKKDSKSYWGTRYMAEVASMVDQIIIMTYDSSITSPWLFSFWVEQQVVYATQAVKNKKARILIGIPAYKEKTASFDPEAENIETGLLGLILGIRNIRSNLESFSGIAIYPYWTMEESDWKTYDTLSGQIPLSP
ncbi:hypothetical protein HZA41_00050 [Candidatus Peregrinibacteria bacterium]|nr:hypothetical protein [Candidatus Peregrinibacteria bacterium]